MIHLLDDWRSVGTGEEMEGDALLACAHLRSLHRHINLGDVNFIGNEARKRIEDMAAKREAADRLRRLEKKTRVTKRALSINNEPSSASIIGRDRNTDSVMASLISPPTQQKHTLRRRPCLLHSRQLGCVAWPQGQGAAIRRPAATL